MRHDIFHQNPDIIPDGMSYPPLFNELDAISGGLSDITPELTMKLGHAAANAAARIAVGYSECSICKLLAHAFIAGAGAAGAQVTEIDAGFFAVASYVAKTYLFNLTVFIENDNGKLRLRMIDKFGLSIDRRYQRQIEYFASIGTSSGAGISDIVMPKSITGAKEAFAVESAKKGMLDNFSVAVEGKGPASENLKYVLSLSGCEITKPKRGIITLSVSDDGEHLLVRDEDERWYDDGHVSALLTLVCFLTGSRDLAVPATAPSVLEQIATEFGGRIMRIGRDHGAREVFLSQGVLTSAAPSAVFLCSYIASHNETVRGLMERLPTFTLVSREVSLNSDRRSILAYLAEERDGMHKENTGELRVCTDGGWVSISPSRSRSALRITGEGMNEEIASELCNLFVEKAHFIDTNQQK